MKKFLYAILFLCLIVSSSFAEVEINETNFPDAIFRSYISRNFDTDDDGILDNDEISAVDRIYLSGNGITKLNGVKYFTSLALLTCQINSLTELDLSDFKSLEVLYCSSNSLTTLNLKGCTNLKTLACSYNSLEKLDLKDCSALTTLVCNGNSLKELDLSSNTALMDLKCSNNDGFQTLDLSKNTALKYLRCTSDGLTLLDVSKNIALRRIYCSQNALTTLDLSTNQSLSSASLSHQNISGFVPEVQPDGKYKVDISKFVGLENVNRVSDVQAKNSAAVLESYDTETGIAIFSTRPTIVYYSYDTKSVKTGTKLKVALYALPQITTEQADIEDAYENRTYKFSFKASGASSIKWRIDDKSKLPEGLDITSAGKLVGVPKVQGNFTFSVTAYNAVNSSEYDTKSFTLKVVPCKV